MAHMCVYEGHTNSLMSFYPRQSWIAWTMYDPGYIKFVPGAVSLSKALAQSNGVA